MATRRKVTETWGLKMPDGRVLLQGYGDYPLRSEADVRADFAKELFEQGAVPVLVTKTSTIFYT